MEYDRDRVDDAVLALLWLTTFQIHGIARAWKSHDWDALDRLYPKGMIGDPKSNARSVALTDEGKDRARRLFEELFGPVSQ